MTGKSPKIGVRAPEGDSLPIFGYLLDIREVLIIKQPGYQPDCFDKRTHVRGNDQRRS